MSSFPLSLMSHALMLNEDIFFLNKFNYGRSISVIHQIFCCSTVILHPKVQANYLQKSTDK